MEKMHTVTLELTEDEATLLGWLGLWSDDLYNWAYERVQDALRLSPTAFDQASEGLYLKTNALRGLRRTETQYEIHATMVSSKHTVLFTGPLRSFIPNQAFTFDAEDPLRYKTRDEAVKALGEAVDALGQVVTAAGGRYADFRIVEVEGEV